MSDTKEASADSNESKLEQQEIDDNETTLQSDQENTVSEELEVVESPEDSASPENNAEAEKRLRGDSVVSIPEITLPEFLKQPGENAANSGNSAKNASFMSCEDCLEGFEL